MRVLVTGSDGYIGSVLAPMLADAGHAVVGLDSCLYEGCDFGDEGRPVPTVRKDIRDLEVEDLDGFDAIVHLAGVSNDPVGHLNAEATFAINHAATVRTATFAKEAGVSRFLFSSSCSVYGAAGDRALDEEAPLDPITPYALSKAVAERDLGMLADDRFCPVYLRNATAYGLSPRLRSDLVVNVLVAVATATGEVPVLSDGTPWRPLVHVEDICRAFIAALDAPAEVVCEEAFNVGLSTENYRVREIAALVADAVQGSRVVYADDGRPDARCYRVSCDKIARSLADFKPQWTVRRGIDELYAAFRAADMTLDEITGSRYVRLARIKELQAAGLVDTLLRRARAEAAVGA